MGVRLDNRGVFLIVVFYWITEITVRTNAQCQDGPEHLLRENCYVQVPDIASWDEARERCLQEGGTLPDVTDDVTQRFMEGLMVRLGVNSMWLDSKDTILDWHWSKDGSIISHQGCHTYNVPWQQDLQFTLNINDMVPSKCMDACRGRNKTYAGIQSKIECYCGDEYGQYGRLAGPNDVWCSITCPGNESLYCGGWGANSIYNVDGGYSAWRYRQPDGTDSMCAIIDSVGNNQEFADEKCYKKHKYICDIPKSSCGRRMFSKNGNCFYIGKKSSWWEAYSDCGAMGGNLVSIKNSAKHELVKEALKNLDEQVWIGLTRSNWTWASSGSSFNYTNWADMSPGKTDQNCLLLSKDTGFKWSDKKCDENHPVICTVPASTTAIPTTESTTIMSSTLTETTDGSSAIPSTLNDISTDMTTSIPPAAAETTLEGSTVMSTPEHTSILMTSMAMSSPVTTTGSTSHNPTPNPSTTTEPAKTSVITTDSPDGTTQGELKDATSQSLTSIPQIYTTYVSTESIKSSVITTDSPDGTTQGELKDATSQSLTSIPQMYSTDVSTEPTKTSVITTDPQTYSTEEELTKMPSTTVYSTVSKVSDNRVSTSLSENITEDTLASQNSSSEITTNEPILYTEDGKPTTSQSEEFSTMNMSNETTTYTGESDTTTYTSDDDPKLTDIPSTTPEPSPTQNISLQSTSMRPSEKPTEHTESYTLTSNNTHELSSINTDINNTVTTAMHEYMSTTDNSIYEIDASSSIPDDSNTSDSTGGATSTAYSVVYNRTDTVDNLTTLGAVEYNNSLTSPIANDSTPNVTMTTIDVTIGKVTNSTFPYQETSSEELQPGTSPTFPDTTTSEKVTSHSPTNKINIYTSPSPETTQRPNTDETNTPTASDGVLTTDTPLNNTVDNQGDILLTPASTGSSNASVDGTVTHATRIDDTITMAKGSDGGSKPSTREPVTPVMGTLLSTLLSTPGGREHWRTEEVSETSTITSESNNTGDPGYGRTTDDGDGGWSIVKIVMVAGLALLGFGLATSMVVCLSCKKKSGGRKTNETTSCQTGPANPPIGGATRVDIFSTNGFGHQNNGFTPEHEIRGEDRKKKKKADKYKVHDDAESQDISTMADIRVNRSPSDRDGTKKPKKKREGSFKGFKTSNPLYEWNTLPRYYFGMSKGHPEKIDTSADPLNNLSDPSHQPLPLRQEVYFKMSQVFGEQPVPNGPNLEAHKTQHKVKSDSDRTPTIYFVGDRRLYQNASQYGNQSNMQSFSLPRQNGNTVHGVHDGRRLYEQAGSKKAPANYYERKKAQQELSGQNGSVPQKRAHSFSSHYATGNELQPSVYDQTGSDGHRPSSIKRTSSDSFALYHKNPYRKDASPTPSPVSDANRSAMLRNSRPGSMRQRLSPADLVVPLPPKVPSGNKQQERKKAPPPKPPRDRSPRSERDQTDSSKPKARLKPVAVHDGGGGSNGQNVYVLNAEEGITWC